MAHRPAMFQARAEGFSPVNAWWLSELCRLIYRKDTSEGVVGLGRASRNDFLARVGLVERHVFSGPATQAALVETEEADEKAFAVLVFRGTTGRLSNWLYNLDMVASKWPVGGNVHRGFRNIIMKLWDPIATVLEKIDKQLFFTGHSLGGALATLAASLRPPCAVYTFGAPRIGDAAFAQTLAGVPVFNVFNPKDIVTGLPPVSQKTRFTHVGAIVRNIEVKSPRGSFAQAPSFLANHAPLNYTFQLPVDFDN